MGLAAETLRMHPLLASNQWQNAVAIQDDSTLKIAIPRSRVTTSYMTTSEQDLADIVDKGIAFIDLRTTSDPGSARWSLPLLGIDAREGRPSLIGSFTEAPPEMVGALARMMGAEVYNLPELKLAPQMFRPMSEQERAMRERPGLLFDVTPLMHMDDTPDRYSPAEAAGHLLDEWQALDELIQGGSMTVNATAVPDRFTQSQLAVDYHSRTEGLRHLSAVRNILAYETWKFAADNYGSARESYAGAVAGVNAYFAEREQSIEEYRTREGYEHLQGGIDLAVQKLADCGLRLTRKVAPGIDNSPGREL